MNEKLKNDLITALKQAGMDEGLASSFEGQDEKTIETFINGLKKPTTISPEEFVASPAFDRYLEEKGFDDLLAKSKKAQSAFDKKTSKALSTFKKNLLGEEGGTDDPIETPEGKPANDPVLKALQAMQAEIASLKAETNAQKAQATVSEQMAKSKLPKDIQKLWVGRVVADSDTPIAEQITALETEYTTISGVKPEVSGGYPFDQARRQEGGLSKSEEQKLADVAKKFK